MFILIFESNSFEISYNTHYISKNPRISPIRFSFQINLIKIIKKKKHHNLGVGSNDAPIILVQANYFFQCLNLKFSFPPETIDRRS